MKVFVIFDAYVDSYQVNDRMAELENINGVNSAKALERVSGEVPRYCLEIDIEDEGAQETGEKLKSALGQYSSYMSNVAWGAYKKL